MEMKGEGEEELKNVYSPSYRGQLSPASKGSRQLTLFMSADWPGDECEESEMVLDS